MTNTRKRQPILMYIALFAVLVALPGVGWLYLQRGLDYQRNIRADMANHGNLPSLPMDYLIQGSVPDSLNGKLYIIGFGDLAQKETASYFGEQLEKLQRQFPVPDLIKFLVMIPNTVEQSAVEKFIEQYQLKTKTQSLVFLLPADQLGQQLKAFAFPSDMSFGPANPLAVLVDDSLHIRNHFQLMQEEELFKLVEQAAIIAPKPAEKSVIYAPEKEK